MKTVDEKHDMTTAQLRAQNLKASTAALAVACSTAGQAARGLATALSGDPVAATLTRRSASRSS